MKRAPATKAEIIDSQNGFSASFFKISSRKLASKSVVPRSIQIARLRYNGYGTGRKLDVTYHGRPLVVTIICEHG
jgi:hypothetical protein